MKENDRPTPSTFARGGGLWNIDDFADFMRISRKAAYALVASGSVPRIRIGVRLRFQPQAVEAWVRAQARTPESQLRPDGNGTRTR